MAFPPCDSAINAQVTQETENFQSHERRPSHLPMLGLYLGKLPHSSLKVPRLC